MKKHSTGGALTDVLRDNLRLVGSAGANKLMAGELSRLVRRAHDDVRVPVPRKEGSGAVCYPFDIRMAATAVRFHRTSARVLWELYRTPASRLEPLYESLKGAIGADQRAWLDGDRRISVQAFGVQEFAAGSRQVVGAVKNALLDGAAERGFSLRVDPESPELLFDVRLVGEEVSVSLDLAGRPMHQRGYRQIAGAAPLREDLAAMLVMLTRHDSRREVLLDPMTGSGTIAIEAACMAKGRYAWSSGRTPLCAGMGLFKSEFAQHRKALFPDTEPLIIARDVDPEVFGAAQKNMQTAGVESSCDLACADFRSITRQQVEQLARDRGLSADTGVILCNPPYGERLSEDELDELYADLRHWCSEFKGWRAGFLVANPEFEYVFDRRPSVKKPLFNGPLKAMFYLYEL